MRTYDVAIVLRGSLPAEKRKKLQDLVKSWLNGVKITKEDTVGEKTLSFPIKRERSGYYIFFSLQTEEVLPTDFDKKIRGHEDILRHLIVRSKDKKPATSETQKKKETPREKKTKIAVKKARKSSGK